MSSDAFNQIRHNFEASFLGSDPDGGTGIREMLIYFITCIKAEHDHKFWDDPVTELTRTEEGEGE